MATGWLLWFKITIHNIFDSTAVSMIGLFCTLYSIFFDDIKFLYYDRSADIYFDYGMLIAIAIFYLEELVPAWTTEGHLFCFYFNLNLTAATLGFFDISFIARELIQGGDSDITGSSAQEEGKAIGVTGSRTTKLASKASRVFRIVRLFRLVRLMKLYKIFMDVHRRRQQQKMGRLILIRLVRIF